jgi:hypothetical protein
MGQKVQGSSFSSTARDAPELAALQGLVAASSGVCCVIAASSHAPKLAALQQQASSGACCNCCVAAKQCAAKQRAAKQRAAKLQAWLRSLLRCSKGTRRKLQSLAPKLAALQQSNAQQSNV